MRVYCTVAYLAGFYEKGPLYEPHMACLAFVKTVKGEPLKTKRMLGGHMMHPSDVGGAVAVFGDWVLGVLSKLEGTVWLIPVPGSKIVRETRPEDVLWPAFDLAECAAGEFGGDTNVLDILRFREPHASAHVEKNRMARNRSWLARQLVLTSSLPDHGTFVLVDDVLATGAHLRACRDVLRRVQPRIDPIAVCAAHRVKKYAPQPFPYPVVVTL